MVYFRVRDDVREFAKIIAWLIQQGRPFLIRDEDSYRGTKTAKSFFLRKTAQGFIVDKDILLRIEDDKLLLKILWPNYKQVG